MRARIRPARRATPCVAALLAALVYPPPAGAADAAPSPAQAKFFTDQVLPILKANCFKCHGGEKTRGGLRLTSRGGILQGGDQGPAVSLENPAGSLLLKAIHYQDGLEMPPRGKLSAADRDVLTRWVRDGIPWPGSTDVAQPSEPPSPRITAEARKYWAYQPVTRPAPPAVRDAAWVRNPIDAFLLARLEAKGLTPAPPADPVALLRRVRYDLTGLPPTPEEIDAFRADHAPAAYERLVDRLLQSPQYGEKWGRHWLDLVRFAETNGYERDGPKPNAWRFRDYVIQSFNDDKPFDRFVLEQLAGDELPDRDADSVISTGYYRLGLWDDEPADPKQARYDEFDDIVATTAQVFLGMTMNCARCHDHKIDPLPQTDYYRLLAFFHDLPPFSDTRNVVSRFNQTDLMLGNATEEAERQARQRRARLDELQAAMTKIEDTAIRRMPVEDQRLTEGIDRPAVLARKLSAFLRIEEVTAYKNLKDELDRLQNEPRPKRRREPPTPGRIAALSVNLCLVNPPPTHVLIRGSAHAPGKRVEPGFPEVLGVADPVIPPPGPGARSSGRRTVLAKWIADKSNPLTARVLANRIWQHHFGRGIVPTPNDFGKFGLPPTHPELLDWLAAELVDGGWRLKRLHKLLLMSNAYRMSSRTSAAGLKEDPANNLFWRFNPRRLTAEEVRDSILAVSGRLNLKAGGPSVYPPIPPEVLAGQSRPGEGWGRSSPDEAARRSVYVYVKRSLLVPVLAHHDQADTDSSCPVRYTTTVPTQSLSLLNGDFSQEQAEAFAARLRRESPGDLTAQVRRAIRLTTGRVPDDDEVGKDVAFVRGAGSDDAALRQYCLLLLNANEFIYLD